MTTHPTAPRCADWSRLFPRRLVSVWTLALVLLPGLAFAQAVEVLDDARHLVGERAHHQIDVGCGLVAGKEADAQAAQHGLADRLAAGDFGHAAGRDGRFDVARVDADYVIGLGGSVIRPGLMFRLPRQGPLLTWRGVTDSAVPDRWDLALGDIELF